MKASTHQQHLSKFTRSLYVDDFCMNERYSLAVSVTDFLIYFTDFFCDFLSEFCCWKCPKFKNVLWDGKLLYFKWMSV